MQALVDAVDSQPDTNGKLYQRFLEALKRRLEASPTG
jgi:hypothetical protein